MEIISYLERRNNSDNLEVQLFALIRKYYNIDNILGQYRIRKDFWFGLFIMFFGS